jgi:hypothetical protein
MRYADCRNLVIAMLNVIMLSVAMLNDICHIASVTRLEEISPFGYFLLGHFKNSQ